MAFTAKDKKTGQLFLVAGETAKDGVLHDACLPIRPDVAYSGNLLEDSSILSDSTWQGSHLVLAVIDGSELEQVKGSLRIHINPNL